MKLYKNMPVLVTGGAGFIGSHLVEKLVEHQAQVTVLDDLSTGHITNLSNVSTRVLFLKKNITNFDACLRATKNQVLVFHLAALTSVQESLDNPEKCHASNVVGFFNILEACRRNKVRHVILSSSAAVYGTQSQPCSETTPCAPTSGYGFSKLIGELYCKQFSRDYNLSTTCLRYFNVYGPRQSAQGPYATVVAQFEYAMQHDLPITVFGDGLQTRDFISVHDVVAANLQVGLIQTKQNAEVYNVASGLSISLLALIERLKEKYPLYNAPIHFKPARPGDIYNSQALCFKFASLARGTN